MGWLFSSHGKFSRPAPGRERTASLGPSLHLLLDKRFEFLLGARHQARPPTRNPFTELTVCSELGPKYPL